MKDKDLAAIRHIIDAMKVWKKTRVSMAFTEFIVINQPPNVTQESSITKSIIDYFVSTLGTQGVLGNNGLRDSNAKSFEDWAPGGLMYDISEYMKAQHFSKNITLYYQTAMSEKLGSLKETIERGLEKGAGSIELTGHRINLPPL